MNLGKIQLRRNNFPGSQSVPEDPDSKFWHCLRLVTDKKRLLKISSLSYLFQYFINSNVNGKR